MLEVEVGVITALAQRQAEQPTEVFVGKTCKGGLTLPRINTRNASVHGLEVLRKEPSSAMGAADPADYFAMARMRTPIAAMRNSARPSQGIMVRISEGGDAAPPAARAVLSVAFGVAAPLVPDVPAC